MNYIRTSAGGMLAVMPKSSTVVAVKKQSLVKPVNKTANKPGKNRK